MFSKRKYQVLRTAPSKLVALSLIAISFAPVAAVAAEQRAEIEEVTVTARKREERLIDVPVSAAVLTREEIERYRTRDLAELTERIPGVMIQHAGGGGQGGG